MHVNDPAIIAAMDGQPSTATMNANRDEPAAFFFVIFGLVFEALTTSSTDLALTTSTRDPIVIAALRALKCLVRPEYSGKVMLDATIFDEFINLCYRLAMTEAASIQSHLVEMLTTLVAYDGNKAEDVKSVNDLTYAAFSLVC